MPKKKFSSDHYIAHISNSFDTVLNEKEIALEPIDFIDTELDDSRCFSDVFANDSKIHRLNTFLYLVSNRSSNDSVSLWYYHYRVIMYFSL